MQTNEQLAALAQSGDKAAREELISRNLGLVGAAAKKFNNRGYDSEDLFQIGVIGLIKSVDKFDQNFGVKFSTYATPMIVGEIRRFLRDDSMIRVSRSLKEIGIKARHAASELSQRYGRAPTIDELAAAVDTDTLELLMAIEARSQIESLNQSIRTPDGGERLLIDTLDADTRSEQRLTDHIALRQIIGQLPQRERSVVIMRYFGDKTQQQVADALGVSQVQVSRIERRALKQLKENITR